MSPNEPEVRTITLTGAPPVRIQTAEWPTVAQAGLAIGISLRVRQHADGRRIVYGTGARSRVERAGVLVPSVDGRPDQGATKLAAVDVARQLAGSDGLAALVVDRLFSSMKPEALR
jgi:uncharacterized protein YqfA (UPF0365 family)